MEQIDTRAFDATLAAHPDVMLLTNHGGLPLARTASGNLTLKADGHGLHVRAEMDPSDPDVQHIVAKMRSHNGRRPLLDQMSFAFRVSDDVWNSS
ncbi:hypothetical protein A5626_01755 [Mycobacterium marseillense]|uniref:HK97 family phage prohead protease n=1 Tax=Mycobacterium marseillense TaxID=701042 RepID=UPI0007FE0B2B|nr:HK97 family phage prohead protease [Mycobacterium marseillense]MCA2265195.1 HK97 family phage prohead protease [Mycobacterium marseillense]OBJ75034.1 hypothetical protein A5626_01755 [Mycobacterium marseillense]